MPICQPSRIRWVRCQAVRWVILSSLCNFMLLTPFKFVESRYRAITHLRSGSFEDSITVPTLTLKYWRHWGQRYGIGLPDLTTWVSA